MFLSFLPCSLLLAATVSSQYAPPEPTPNQGYAVQNDYYYEGGNGYGALPTEPPTTTTTATTTTTTPTTTTTTTTPTTTTTTTTPTTTTTTTTPTTTTTTTTPTTTTTTTTPTTTTTTTTPTTTTTTTTPTTTTTTTTPTTTTTTTTPTTTTTTTTPTTTTTTTEATTTTTTTTAAPTTTDPVDNYVFRPTPAPFAGKAEGPDVPDFTIPPSNQCKEITLTTLVGQNMPHLSQIVVQDRLTPDQQAEFTNAIRLAIVRLVVSSMQAAFSRFFCVSELIKFDFCRLPVEEQDKFNKAVQKMLSCFNKHSPILVKIIRDDVMGVFAKQLEVGRLGARDTDAGSPFNSIGQLDNGKGYKPPSLAIQVTLSLTTNIPLAELITTLMVTDIFPQSAVLTAFSSPIFLNEFKNGIILPIKQVVDNIKAGKFNPLIYALSVQMTMMAVIAGTHANSTDKTLNHVKGIASNLLLADVPAMIKPFGSLKVNFGQVAPYLSHYTLRLPQSIRLVAPGQVPDPILDRLPEQVSYVPILLNFLALDTEIISHRQIKRLIYFLPELRIDIKHALLIPMVRAPVIAPSSIYKLSLSIYPHVHLENVKIGILTKGFQCQHTEPRPPLVEEDNEDCNPHHVRQEGDHHSGEKSSSKDHGKVHKADGSAKQMAAGPEAPVKQIDNLMLVRPLAPVKQIDPMIHSVAKVPMRKQVKSLVKRT